MLYNTETRINSIVSSFLTYKWWRWRWAINPYFHPCGWEMVCVTPDTALHGCDVWCVMYAECEHKRHTSEQPEPLSTPEQPRHRGRTQNTAVTHPEAENLTFWGAWQYLTRLYNTRRRFCQDLPWRAVLRICGMRDRLFKSPLPLVISVWTFTEAVMTP